MASSTTSNDSNTSEAKPKLAYEYSGDFLEQAKFYKLDQYLNQHESDFVTLKMLSRDENNGGMNGGVFISKRLKDGLLVIKKTLVREGLYTDLDAMQLAPGFAHVGSALVEAGYAARLRYWQNRHLNKIIAYIQYGDPESDNVVRQVYFRYCEFGTLGALRNFYRQDGFRLPEEFLWQVLRSVACALSTMHEGTSETLGLGSQGPTFNYIVHGDVKLDNIFLEEWPGHPYPFVVLGDYGCCTTKETLRFQNSQTWFRRGTLRGTSDYWPPEEDHGFSSRATDIFALGIVMLKLMGVSPGRAVQLRHQSQIDRLRESKYSPKLQEVTRLTLKLQQPERIQAMQLVYQIDQAVKGLVKAGKLGDVNAANARRCPPLRPPYFEDEKYNLRQPRAFKYDDRAMNPTAPQIAEQGRSRSHPVAPVSQAAASQGATSGSATPERPTPQSPAPRATPQARGGLGQGGIHAAARGVSPRPRGNAANAPRPSPTPQRPAANIPVARPTATQPRTGSTSQQWPAAQGNPTFIPRQHVQ